MTETAFNYPAMTDDGDHPTEAFFLRLRDATDGARAVVWHPHADVFGTWHSGDTASIYSLNHETGAVEFERTITLGVVHRHREQNEALPPADRQRINVWAVKSAIKTWLSRYY